jgi:Mg-chelatase subunit ChlD
MKMKTGYRWMLSVAALVLAAAAAGHGAPAAPGARPRVEVAFVLDSTGSMGGLIEGAKQKIWSIANSLVARRPAAGLPAPEVRIGLVTYRDRGDQYVTRLHDLTADIDTVFRDLQDIHADGGGDDQESVNQALYEAVHRLGWSADPEVLKIVFLVGDYPPHMDYRGEAQYPETCRAAATRGLVVNTVQCGGVPETTRVWKDIARLAEGAYVALEQSGNMQAVPTPYDGEIASLSAEVSRTVVAWGARERRAEAEAKTRAAAEAPAAVAADRAAFNLATGGKAIQGGGDLVEDLAGGVDLARIKKEELPPQMQGLSLEEQKAYLAGRRAAREALNLQLSELSQRRAAFLLQEQQQLAGAGDSFDRKVAEIVGAQLERKLR